MAETADSADSPDLADSTDSVDSTDSADLADLPDSYFNLHLDRLVYFAIIGSLLLFNREVTVKISI